ncbi:MAG TPA: hypothetical protein VLA56_13245 [Pseudomonadales bacterium]|nr:hypothetical protein [Pseudomonadales bacterium]
MLLTAPASAQTERLLCCGTKTCPEGQVADETNTACCNPDGSGCTPTANLGKRCNDDLAAAAAGMPERGNVAGCVEVPGACIGGQIGDDSGPVAGCVCLGDVCEADVDFPNGKPNCTRIAVDACCEAGACL